MKQNLNFIRSLLITLLLSVSLFVIPQFSPIRAGGTFECFTIPSTHPSLARCALKSQSCTSGSVPTFADGRTCEQLSISECSPLNNISQPCQQTTLTCDWTPLQNSSGPYNGQPSFCIGGFSSESELQSYTVRFSCEGLWCGSWLTRAWNWITGNAAQEFSLSSCSVGGSLCDVRVSGGKYFTCLTGDFNSSIKDTIMSEISRLGFTECFLSGSLTVSGGTVTIKQDPDKATQCVNAYQQLMALITPRLQGVLVSSAGINVCSDSFNVRLSTTGGIEPVPGSLTELGATPICTFAKNVGKQVECETCQNNAGVWSPFGCINATPQKFVAQILEIAIGIGGGLAFLMIVYGGFVIMTSSGNPEKLNGGKEIVTSAIAGLLLIVFSVVILKIIGVDILKIPGL